MEQQAPAGFMDRIYDAAREHPFIAKLAVGAGMLGAGGAAELAMADTASASDQQPAVTMVSRGLNASAFDVASKKIIIGESEHIKIDQKTASQCIETKPGQPWTNSVTLPSGGTYYYTETTPAKLCHDKYSPTGWVKRGGGESGLDCKNAAKPIVMPKAHENVEVINVNKLNTRFTLVARVALNGSVECPGVQSSGSAFAEVRQKFNLRNYLRMKGNGQVNIDFKLADRAKVKAGLSLNCTSTETTTPQTPEQPPVTSPQRPSIVIENMPTEGGFLGDTQQFCAKASSNPASDGVEVDFSSKYNMPQTATYADPNGDPNSYCTTETFNAIVPDEKVFAEAIDKFFSNQTASASSNPFPVRQSTGF